MIGSAAMASCYVASGKAELYKEKGIYLWDIIAGAAIVESAGGRAEINNINEAFQVVYSQIQNIKNFMKSLVWLRNDLRMDDNSALKNACYTLMRFTVCIFSARSNGIS